MITWRSNLKDKALFMQMIGDTDLLKDEFFITKKSGDEKYTLVIISEKKK